MKIKKYSNIIIIISLLLLIGIIYYISKKTIEIPDVEFPFKNVKDQNNQNLNIMVITAPFRSDKDKDNFNKYVNTYNIHLSLINNFLDSKKKNY